MESYLNLKQSLKGALVLALLFSMSSCAKKFAFATSQVVPAAEGKVKVKKGKNDNYNISLDVIRLAEPQRLQPSRSHYVVWMETEQNGTKNIGQLESKSGFLSKILKAELKTVTPFEPRQFFITAEDDATIQYPKGQIVLRTGNL
jgi:hypothetical protein